MSNLSDNDEDEHDLVAEYEHQRSDEEQNDIRKDLGSGSETEGDKVDAVRRIDPSTSKKRVVTNPLPKLNTERLTGPKGIQTIEKYFDGFKFHGKGYEKYDLDRIMKRLEHWGHRLFPKLDFDDFLDRLEKLGTKRDLQVFIKKYRQDMVTNDDEIIDEDDENMEESKDPDEPIDEFDLLIAEQIEKQKQMVGKSANNVPANEETFDRLLSETNAKNSQPESSTNSTPSQLTDEVKERIERNRQQAIQRRLARLKEIEEEAKRKREEKVNGTQSEIIANENTSNEVLEDNSGKVDEHIQC